jgi:ABC-type dipeptide/oligopeptide/nickel transport system permease subunit
MTPAGAFTAGSEHDAPPVSDDGLAAAASIDELPRSALGRVGFALVGTFTVLALAAPVIAPYGPTEVTGLRLDPPSLSHLLGTSLASYDVASQVLLGARTSLVVAVVAGGGSLLIGALVGIVAGWFGGRVDALVMRVVDVVMIVPKLPLLILAGALVGRNLLGLAVTIALISWPVTARALRAEVLSLRRRAHLRASVGFGAGSLHVLRRHLVPELRLIMIARLVTAAGMAVGFEAGLAFLGLGDPTRVSWGSMMAEALAYPGLLYEWAWSWWLMAPLVSLVLVLLGLTFLGVAAESGVNPQLVRHDG